MAVTLNGTGISYGEPIENQYSDQSAATAIQSDTNCIVQVKFTSASTLNQSASGDGSDTYLTGSQIDMGIPTKSTNWYRLYYQTIVDDNDGSIGGMGVDAYRYTPSAGWERVLATGSHWSYDNNMADWYRSANIIFWIPVNQTYPDQAHSFKLHIRTHNVANLRWNCDIGGALRNGGHVNNTIECWEVDGNKITTNNLTRY